MHCDIDLGGMTLSQGHDTPLRHGQQLCEIYIQLGHRNTKFFMGPGTMLIDGQTYGRTDKQTDIRTDRQTDRPTDRQTDKGIPIYPNTLFVRDISTSSGRGLVSTSRAYVSSWGPGIQRPECTELKSHLRRKWSTEFSRN